MDGALCCGIIGVPSQARTLAAEAPVSAAPRAPSLHIDPATDLLAGVRQVLSPHCDERPSGVTPDLLVIHAISLPPKEFGGPWIEQLFTGNLPAEAHPAFGDIAKLRVSAHALIRRNGTITQFVPFGKRAWHAGRSQYQGRSACNDFSVGIELEGTDTTPYTEPQYESLAALVAALLATYPTLSAERIAGHSDIAPGRKTDPGPAFDWSRWREMLSSRLHGSGIRSLP